MKVAVLSLVRDRLEYTEHCFASIRENAGCPFDHFVLDQASEDGTGAWLAEQFLDGLVMPPIWETENIGISRGMNRLLDELGEGYDVIVKFDNDCELVQPDTLRIVCELVMEGGWLLSPRILGLQNPPPVMGGAYIGETLIQDVPQIGGIFLAAPASLYDSFRYSESNPLWGHDDIEICRWFRRQGGSCGYVESLEAWHYKTTDGQQTEQPAYFERKFAEMGLA